ncbi:hypothetical protein FOZ60_012012 [Perkinsus olseni]|uniref:Uncharacterized protein n=1 Tax=Perkinsus olseni TaxID=32597 RepID=A0A7J6PCB5_PEROL|nr:hypothetical protein FOZ60_012012 [Perkinsus olseni]
MGKKSKHKDDGAVNLALIINFLSLGLMTVLIFMPYWQFSPMIPALSFPQRNIGLFKASGKYTPVLRTAADLTWIQIRSSTCDVAMAEQGLPKQSVASVITAVTGSECPPICLFQLNLRCQFYRIFFYLNFLVAALVVLGPLISFLASVMPLIVKERKSDRFLYFLICASGAAAASTGLIVYAGFSTYMYSKFNQYGYYPSPSLSICFYVAVAGALMLCGSSFVLYGRANGAAEGVVWPSTEEDNKSSAASGSTLTRTGGSDPGHHMRGISAELFESGTTPMTAKSELRTFPTLKTPAPSAGVLRELEMEMLRAVRAGDPQRVAKLLNRLDPRSHYSSLSQGADVNAVRHSDGDTPLMLAVRGGDTKMVHLLLEYGANPSVRNRRNESPLILAAQLNKHDIYSLLIGRLTACLDRHRSSGERHACR